MSDSNTFDKLDPKVPDLSKIYLPRNARSIPMLKRNPVEQQFEANYASAFSERLAKMIQDFDASLDQAHEVGVRLVSFGKTVIFALENMGYSNPSLITFRGHTTEGEPVELIQHVSQISILLMRLPRKNPQTPKKPIGFKLKPENDTEASERSEQ
jgi:hypothetical protein